MNVVLGRKNHVRRPPMRINIREAVQISSHCYGRDALPRDPAWHVSNLVFGLLPWPLTRVQGIWLLFASMDVPRRIARERVPAMGVDFTPYVDAHGRPPDGSDELPAPVCGRRPE